MVGNIEINNIPKAFQRAFNKAVSLGENLYEDGSVNWNYVDADLFMQFGPRDSEINERYLSELHYEMFELLADAYERANGKQIQQDTVIDSSNGIFSEYAEEGLNTIYVGSNQNQNFFLAKIIYSIITWGYRIYSGGQADTGFWHRW